ncbi:MAG TPA: hypothetical protein VMZ31_15110 [Phycisphaerae bacterium]|nr:hypothetical protein [Phycisphaerae bacterium]
MERGDSRLRFLSKLLFGVVSLTGLGLIFPGMFLAFSAPLATLDLLLWTGVGFFAGSWACFICTSYRWSRRPARGTDVVRVLCCALLGAGVGAAYSASPFNPTDELILEQYPWLVWVTAAVLAIGGAGLVITMVAGRRSVSSAPTPARPIRVSTRSAMSDVRRWAIPTLLFLAYMWLETHVLLDWLRDTIAGSAASWIILGVPLLLRWWHNGRVGCADRTGLLEWGTYACFGAIVWGAYVYTLVVDPADWARECVSVWVAANEGLNFAFGNTLALFTYVNEMNRYHGRRRMLRFPRLLFWIAFGIMVSYATAGTWWLALAFG